MKIELPNGSTLIMGDDTSIERIVLISKGLSISAEILPANEFAPNTNAWADREIELYERALEIDLNAEKDFIKECLMTQINNSINGKAIGDD